MKMFLIPGIDIYKISPVLILKMLPYNQMFLQKLCYKRTCCSINNYFVNLERIVFCRIKVYTLNKWLSQIFQLLTTLEPNTEMLEFPTCHFDLQDMTNLFCILLFITDQIICCKPLNFEFRNYLYDTFSQYFESESDRAMFKKILFLTNKSQSEKFSSSFIPKMKPITKHESCIFDKNVYFVPIQSSCMKKWKPICTEYIGSEVDDGTLIFAVSDKHECKLFVYKHKIKIKYCNKTEFVEWVNKQLLFEQPEQLEKPEQPEQLEQILHLLEEFSIQEFLLLLETINKIKNIKFLGSFINVYLENSLYTEYRWPFNNCCFVFFLVVYIYDYMSKSADRLNLIQWADLTFENCLLESIKKMRLRHVEIPSSLFKISWPKNLCFT